MKKSSSNINTDADAYLPDNLTEEIAEGDVRDRIKDIADSFLNLSDGGLVIDTETGYSTAITPSSDYSFATKKYVDDEISGISVTPVWGSITGTVTDQTDLITYLQTNYAELSDLSAYLKLDLSNSPLTGDTLTSTQTTFNLFNTTVTTLRLGGEATSVIIGLNGAGTTNLRNATIISGNASISLFNTTNTTITFAGATTTLNIGVNNLTQTHNYSAGATLSGNTKTLNFGTGGVAGSITNINIGSTLGTGTISLFENTSITGTSQNALTVNNGLKVGNNTDSAATAGAGSIRYNSGLNFSDGSNWLITPSTLSGATNKLAWYSGTTAINGTGANYFDGTNLVLGGGSPVPVNQSIFRFEKGFTTDPGFLVANSNSAQSNHTGSIGSLIVNEFSQIYHYKPTYNIPVTAVKYLQTLIDNTGSITTAYNTYSEFNNSGTISTAIHFGNRVGTNTGTITNEYFLWNGNNNMKGTNKWFLYNDDNTVNSYLKGQLQLVGSPQNALVVTNGIKIGNNTDSASTAGGGSLKYVSSTLQYSDGSNWNTVGNATILTATTTIIEASWSGNTDYEYSVTVTGAVAGDFCMIMPNDTVMGSINTASADWKGYAYCSSANTVTVVCRVSSFISVSGTFTVKVIK